MILQLFIFFIRISQGKKIYLNKNLFKQKFSMSN